MKSRIARVSQAMLLARAQAVVNKELDEQEADAWQALEKAIAAGERGEDMKGIDEDDG